MLVVVELKMAVEGSDPVEGPTLGGQSRYNRLMLTARESWAVIVRRMPMEGRGNGGLGHLRCPPFLAYSHLGQFVYKNFIGNHFVGFMFATVVCQTFR